MEAIVGSGKFSYKVHEDWAKVPADIEMKPAAVAVDDDIEVEDDETVESTFLEEEEEEEDDVAALIDGDIVNDEEP